MTSADPFSPWDAENAETEALNHAFASDAALTLDECEALSLDEGTRENELSSYQRTRLISWRSLSASQQYAQMMGDGTGE